MADHRSHPCIDTTFQLNFVFNVKMVKRFEKQKNEIHLDVLRWVGNDKIETFSRDT